MTLLGNTYVKVTNTYTYFLTVVNVASSGQFVMDLAWKSHENKDVDEDSKIQCFQTPHTPTFGAMTLWTLGASVGLKFVVFLG